MATQNGTEEKKPGIVRKITRITFTIGPIRQEDLSTPELNKLMAMAQRFEITFDTVPILDTEHSDKLGYITLPFEIRTQDYLLVLYDRLNNLKLGGGREVAVKFPDELKRHVDECRLHNAEMKKKRIEEAKEKEEKMKRSIYATFVDKDTGRDSLVEKFPEAKEITVRQHNFQWFGVLEFESVEEAQAVLKKSSQIEIEGQKVKIVKQAPDYEEPKQFLNRDQKPFQKKRPMSSPRGGFHRGGDVSAPPLLGMAMQRGDGRIGSGILGSSPRHMGDIVRFNQGYNSGYSNQGGFNQGGFNEGGYHQGGYLGAKRKTDFGEYSGSSNKRPFGEKRGGMGGHGGWGGR